MAKFLITIVGATAIGKTSLAIVIAERYSCEIISCDSRQFYKEMSIGTAVPSEAELKQAKHHFIHNNSVFDIYSVGDFEKEALNELNVLFKTNDFAVLVGGSGLYVDAVLKGFDDFPKIDDGVREGLQKSYSTFGIEYLQQELQRLDPDYLSVVDSKNPQRLMRALEICLGTGKPYSAFLKIKKPARNFIPILIGLEADRKIIYERIEHRVDGMLASGLLQEAEKLHPHKKLNALQTVGYRELFRYFDGEISLDFAISEIKKNTRRFAKRQLTWFKRNDDVQWFKYDAPQSEIFSFIDSEVKSNPKSEIL